VNFIIIHSTTGRWQSTLVGRLSSFEPSIEKQGVSIATDPGHFATPHYYTYVSDEENREKTTFAKPFDLYRYGRLAMGLSCATDIATQHVEEVLDDLTSVVGLIDDVATLSLTTLPCSTIAGRSTRSL